MDLRQLEVFAKVYEQKSFSKAAQELFPPLFRSPRRQQADRREV